MRPWDSWHKEVEAQTAKKTPLTPAQRAALYRKRKEKKAQQPVNPIHAVSSSTRGNKEHEIKIRLSSFGPNTNVQREGTQVHPGDFASPSFPNELSFEVITPLSINSIFSFLRQRGYAIDGLYESFTPSSMAAVNENITFYSPLFPSIKANSIDCPYPVVVFTFPGEVAFERYPLCSSCRIIDYQPVVDLIETIEILSNTLMYDSSNNLKVNLQQLKLAVAQKDYPVFESALKNINKIFSSSPPLTSPDTQCMVQLLQEIYDRCLKPRRKKLKGGQDETVYGELMPSFLEHLFEIANIGPHSSYLDLGSGIGNTVTQAALTRGCTAYGIEINGSVADIADLMLEAAITRSKIWGVSIGHMEVIRGDMMRSAKVLEWVQAADLVLANNFKFEKLNEDMKTLLKLMKPNAILVSLKSFQVAGTTRSGRIRANNEDVGHLFEVSKHQYLSGDVSWTDQGGDYYIHRKIT
ncbi:hypothetical protein D9757_004568 [Collybiopsis confluens]|uniref:Histone-lysine N-methyltransferase, H3 lysine-79 specific n=1 Tax=Collybiopsis confluens TaxID=2823264 RepID=A0A8H5HWG6_9AGAR|nr:hypothetical protein D9757_004568 [Collybiopsis confluens]